MIILIRIEMLQVTQHGRHIPELAETISNKDPVDVLNLKENK